MEKNKIKKTLKEIIIGNKTTYKKPYLKNYIKNSS